MFHMRPGLRHALASMASMAALSCGGDDSDGKSSSPAPDAAEHTDAQPTPSCAPRTAEDGLSTIEIEHDGNARSYLLYVPPDLDDTAAPLLLNYHGLTSNAAQQRLLSNIEGLADREGFIVAYPEGLAASHNAGSCCGQMVGNTANDGDFARVIVDDIATRLCVDPQRVYSTGMSNGGYMSEYNACVNADLFAAVAPVSAMAIQQPVCSPSRPVPMIAFNGTTDPLVAYGSARRSIDAWIERNGCTGEPSREPFGASYCESWTDCAPGVELVACTIEGMDHCWPGNTMTIPGFCASGGLEDIDANQMIWDFLSRHALP